MSEENVELVLRLVPPPEIDIAPLIRDEQLYRATAEANAALFHPELESEALWDEGRTYAGLDGFRDLWRDWLEPWAEYHVQIEDVIDLGDRVVLLIRDRGRRRDMNADVELVSGSIWDFRDGMIRKVTFCRDRADALEAAGPSE